MQKVIRQSLLYLFKYGFYTKKMGLGWKKKQKNALRNMNLPDNKRRFHVKI
jgi:hypothetical protein